MQINVYHYDALNLFPDIIFLFQINAPTPRVCYLTPEALTSDTNTHHTLSLSLSLFTDTFRIMLTNGLNVMYILQTALCVCDNLFKVYSERKFSKN